MSDAYLGEIRLYASARAPRGWALCRGQLLSIQQNQALFSLLGTKHGGDGRNTFGLPDLRGRVPVGQGQGPHLSNRFIGSRFGTEAEPLSSDHLPNHNHPMVGSTIQANSLSPINHVPATLPDGYLFYEPEAEADKLTAFSSQAVAGTGGGKSHNNVMPSAVLHYIICIDGAYPQR